MPENKITIAVDGYASCGKSTISRALAKKLGYIFIDSGAMYRALTLYVLQHNINPEDETAINQILPQVKIEFKHHKAEATNHTYLNGKDVEEAIRRMDVSAAVSPVAKIGLVRKTLVALQQEMGKTGGVVMDGRDIGTVVFPHAQLKIFVTASIEVRTDRRYNELISKGIQISREEVKQNLLERDYIDSHRENSPLTQAPDAMVLDTSNLSPAEQLKQAYNWASKQITGN